MPAQAAKTAAQSAPGRARPTSNAKLGPASTAKRQAHPLAAARPTTRPALGTRPASASSRPGRTATAQRRGSRPTTGKELLVRAGLALAGMVISARASHGRVDPKVPNQAPFWRAVKSMASTLRDIERQIAAKDRRVPSTLSRGSERLATVKTLWPRAGVRDPKVARYVRDLDHAYTALRSAYGGDGARARRGGQLSPAERDRLKKIQAAQTAFAAKLAPVRERARQRGDKGTEAAMTRMIEQANRVAQAPPTVPAMLMALPLADAVQGEWDGYVYYAPPDYRESWAQIDDWARTNFPPMDDAASGLLDPFASEALEHWSVAADLMVPEPIDGVARDELPELEDNLWDQLPGDDLSWQDWSARNVTAELDDAVVAEEEDNLEVAAGALTAQDLPVDEVEGLMDEDPADASTGAEEQARVAAEEQEQARIDAEEQEQARLDAEEQEQARIDAEEQEQARLDAEEQEQARIDAEEQEQERLDAEEQEQARIDAEEQEQERMDAEAGETWEGSDDSSDSEEDEDPPPMTIATEAQLEQ